MPSCTMYKYTCVTYTCRWICPLWSSDSFHRLFPHVIRRGSFMIKGFHWALQNIMTLQLGYLGSPVALIWSHRTRPSPILSTPLAPSTCWSWAGHIWCFRTLQLFDGLSDPIWGPRGVEFQVLQRKTGPNAAKLMLSCHWKRNGCSVEVLAVVYFLGPIVPEFWLCCWRIDACLTSPFKQGPVNSDSSFSK